MTDATSPADRHPIWEDGLAILTGCLLVALGVAFYARATLLFGGSSGMALLTTYATGWPFWATFWLVNLPFYALAVLRMGWAFALRTAAAVTLVSLLAGAQSGWLRLDHVAPLYAAIIGGVLTGVGLLILFRHRTGLGGVNVLALYLQERLGWRAGLTQLAVDLAILAAAVFVLPPDRLALSVLGAVVVNAILTVNHRPGRYTGYS